MLMKRKVAPICNHVWEDLCLFRTMDGKAILQRRCKKCQQTSYVEQKESTNKG